MENEKLINELKAVGFHNATPLMLAKEVKTGYSVIVEFNEEDESLMIANAYYDENRSNEWRKFPVFRGVCETKEQLFLLVGILNLEKEGRDAFYSLVQ